MSSTSYTISRILDARDIVSYLAARGINPDSQIGGRWRFNCPIHKEDTPSMVVYPGDPHQNFFCYGCVEKSELTWTQRGLLPIGDVVVGDRVLDVKGKWSPVIEVSKQTKKMMSIETATLRLPLRLTEDHRCLFLRRGQVVDALSRVRGISRGSGARFFGSRSRGVRRGCEPLAIVEGYAGTVSEGDFWLFPIICEGLRSNDPLVRAEPRKYTKGPRVTRVESLTVNTETAWLYGVYLAEGSICSDGRVLRFTFSLEERESHASRVVRVLKDQFGLTATIKCQPEKNTCEVDCCKVDLCDHLRAAFGSDCDKKTIPAEALSWTRDVQVSLLQGWMDGDGNHDLTAVTVSESLARSAYGIMIQAGLMPSLGCVRASLRACANGSVRRDWYHVRASKRERVAGFYENIAGTEYFITEVSRVVKDTVGEGEVVDLGVEGGDSFTLSNGVVHNCKKGGTIIQLKIGVEGVDAGTAIRDLADGLDIRVDDELAFQCHKMSEESIFSSKLDPQDMAFMIGRIVHNFLKVVKFRQPYFERCEGVLRFLDRLMWRCDFKKVGELLDSLDDYLSLELDKFEEEQERATVDVASAYASIR